MWLKLELSLKYPFFNAFSALPRRVSRGRFGGKLIVLITCPLDDENNLSLVRERCCLGLT